MGRPVRPRFGHEVLAVVFSVRRGELSLLLWQRAAPPDAGAWALPGGALEATETLDESIRRHLAAKVDIRELSHLEQLATISDPRRHPELRLLATAYLGLVPSDLDPPLPSDTAWHCAATPPVLALDHDGIRLAARERLRAKLSYTNLGYALAPPTFTIAELRTLYAAALGHDVSTTNLRRVLLRRSLLVPTGQAAPPGREGGRPAACFRFRSRSYQVTDQFAVLRPPRATVPPPGPEPASDSGARRRRVRR